MFTNLINKTRKVTNTTKHQASKRGHVHTHKLSKGQQNSVNFKKVG